MRANPVGTYCGPNTYQFQLVEIGAVQIDHSRNEMQDLDGGYSVSEFGPVPILINFNGFEIGVVQVTVNEKKFKTWMAVVWITSGFFPGAGPAQQNTGTLT